MLADLFDEQAQREQYDEAVKSEYKEEGLLEAFVRLVKKGMLTLSQAAEEVGMTVAEFEEKTGLNNI